ncbi:MAG: hypothetical protein EA351_04510 [Gemmatimonadales bacterium]|nr:MAG: hypothetical protein EA351_04510 [Gemmatimonadales bacterium]
MIHCTPRLTAALSFGLLVLAGCVTQTVSSSESGGSGWADRPVSTEVVRMDSGIAALQSFEPLVARVTEGGECVTNDMAAEGVRSLSMVYPTLRDPRTQVTVVVDAAGTVLRYSEHRGGMAPRGGSTSNLPTGASGGPPQTTIEMNFQTGQARAINSGGGHVGFGVQGSAADFQYQESLGQPVLLAQQVQQRCSRRD